LRQLTDILDHNTVVLIVLRKRNSFRAFVNSKKSSRLRQSQAKQIQTSYRSFCNK